jgi:hypothetical protein
MSFHFSRMAVLEMAVAVMGVPLGAGGGGMMMTEIGDGGGKSGGMTGGTVLNKIRRSSDWIALLLLPNLGVESCIMGVAAPREKSLGG